MWNPWKSGLQVLYRGYRIYIYIWWETPIYWGYIRGYCWDNGKENGNYYSRLGLCWGLYWDNRIYLGLIIWDIRKENGRYYLGFRV